MKQTPYKCSGTCDNINDPYAKLFLPDVVKNIKMSKYLIQCQELMKQDIQNGKKLINKNVD